MFYHIQEVEEYMDERKRFGIKPGLERIHRLLAMVGNPQNTVKGVHFAGTNGKGSTIQFVAHALMENSLNVGVFSSPSFTGLLGHIQINNTSISEEEFLLVWNQLYPNIAALDEAGMSPTEFEILTAIAFMYFQETVDIMLIEAGMGGRDDTTNCFEPVVSVITTIEKDHMAFLGDTIEEIARHKAGIIKQGTPVVSGQLHPDSIQVIEEVSHQQRAPLFQLHKDFFNRLDKDYQKGSSFRWWFDNSVEHSVLLNVFGSHQVHNASIAMMVLQLLQKHFTLDWKKSWKGISNTTIPGRFEKIHSNPTIIIDGAHNVAGIRAFLKAVESFKTEEQNHLIFTGFRDKEIDKMLELCIDHFDQITLTTFEHPRALSIEDLKQTVYSPKVSYDGDWQRLIRHIQEKRTSKNNYFITGSFDFISKVRNIL